MYSDPKQFTVKRSEWLRGEGGPGSVLFRPSDGKRCCVGFFGLACGFTDEQMENVPSIQEASELPWPEYTLRDLGVGELYDTVVMERIYATNDDKSITDESREARLRLEFKKLGVELTFVD